MERYARDSLNDASVREAFDREGDQEMSIVTTASNTTAPTEFLRVKDETDRMANMRLEPGP